MLFFSSWSEVRYILCSFFLREAAKLVSFLMEEGC